MNDCNDLTAALGDRIQLTASGHDDQCHVGRTTRSIGKDASFCATGQMVCLTIAELPA